jgi:enoyl-CoA hydratase/carnithine racemase
VTPKVRLETDGRVATLWLDRPKKRNAMSAAMWGSIPPLLDQAAQDRSVRILVLRGAGEDFCAGADITELGRALAADAEGTSYRATNARAETALWATPLVTIAAIDGACLGGGVQLALACDVRVATERARLGITAARLGITYPSTSLHRLVATVGAPAARRMVLSAEVLDAHSAHRIGLVDRVVEPDDLDATVTALCDHLLSLSAVSQLAAKELVAAIERSGAVPHELGRTWERVARDSDDLTEGLAAFEARRPPSFGPRPEPRAR